MSEGSTQEVQIEGNQANFEGQELSREPFNSLYASLPENLRVGEEILGRPGAFPENSTPGQKEVLTYLKLLLYAEKGLPQVTDDKNKVQGIAFKDQPPLITVNGTKVPVTEIIGFENGNFICRVKGEKDEVSFRADLILNAQRQIVEKSTETGIIKASSVRAFLEAQKVATAEGQQLTEEQIKFNQALEQLIQRVDNHLTVDQSTFAEVIQTIIPNSPDAQEKINLFNARIEEIDKKLAETNLTEEEREQLQNQKDGLQQMINLSNEQIKTLTEEWAQKVYSGEYSPQEIDQINNLLQEGSIESIQELLKEDKDKDSPITKKAKAEARKTAEWLKNNVPTIGAVAGLLLFLMLLQSSRQSGGGSGMMG